MIYRREIEPKIRELGRHFPVVLLTGARQTGKTTLMKLLFPEMRYVSLDLPSLAEKAEQSPRAFLREFPPPLIIDEVQYAPALFRHVKERVDARRSEMGQFFLTGSQKFSLMKGVGDSLAGRLALLELETLSLSEIRAAADSALSLDDLVEIITRGQFPELWRQRSLPLHDFYAGYMATYLERDVRQILNVAKLRDFERFVRVLAARSGQLLNKSEVARDVGVSVKAIGDWISVLEASNVIALLEPYFQNISKRIIKSPKVYFADTGLLCYLLGVSSASFRESPFLGHIWENFIFSELRKKNQLATNPYNIFYYRDQRAREIDFFLERGGAVTLMECKWTEMPEPRAGRQIQQISAEINESRLPLANQKNFVVTTSKHSYPLQETIEVVNLENSLRELFPEK
jgi:predicted AAA+ superfamily ATPase